MELVKWMIHSFVVSALTASEADTAESALQMFPSLVLSLVAHTGWPAVTKGRPVCRYWKGDIITSTSLKCF